MKDNDSIKPSEKQNSSEAVQEEISENISGEIIKNENNSDLFDGEDNENPEWDGSEAEFVEDDSSAEYEIPETGIKLSYALTKEEMYSCLNHSDMFKTKGAKAVIESIILALASVVFFTAYFTSTEFNSYNLFFGIISLLMIAIIWIVPYLHLKSMAKIMADGKTVEVEIYPTRIDIGRDIGAWSIELDGNSEIEEFDNIFMIYTSKDRSFAIPERVLEPEVYNEVKAILFSGTIPKENN